MLTITNKQIDELIEKAKSHERKRAFMALHNPKDSVLKLLNALEKETYVPPHKHEDPERKELFIALRGKLIAILFNDSGEITSSTIIGVQEETLMIEIPANTWHTLFALEDNSVVLEVIKGPYDDKTHKIFASWAPLESDNRAVSYKDELLRQVSI